MISGGGKTVTTKMSYDKTTTKQRIGERHPVYLFIARAVVAAGLSTIALVGVATIITTHATARQEYANAHSFQPVHMNY